MCKFGITRETKKNIFLLYARIKGITEENKAWNICKQIKSGK